MSNIIDLSPRIILLENDAKFAQLTLTEFERDGYLIKWLIDSDDILNIIEHFIPNIIILNWNSVSEGCLKLIAEIRQNQRLNDLKLILISDVYSVIMQLERLRLAQMITYLNQLQNLIYQLESGCISDHGESYIKLLKTIMQTNYFQTREIRKDYLLLKAPNQIVVVTWQKYRLFFHDVRGYHQLRIIRINLL